MSQNIPVTTVENNLDAHIYTDLYQRSRKSVIAYFVFFWALAFLTPFYREQKTAALVMGLLVSVIVGLRFYFAVSYTEQRFLQRPGVWKGAFTVLTILSALLWGFLNVFISSYFGVLSWSGFYCLIMTIGIIAGGTNSLAPGKKMMSSFIVMMMVPFIGWALIQGEYILALFFSIFTGMLVVIAKESNAFYIMNLKINDTVIQQGRNLRDTVDIVKCDSEKLKTSSEDLSDISKSLKASSEDMSTRISGIEDLSLSMKNNSDAISLSVERTSGSVSSVKISLDDISSSINRTSNISEQVKSATAAAVEQALKSSEKNEDLNKIALEIGKITEMISDISDQTNLLALNATIEAARAGETGKGFAVVANEIKELSKQTADATAKIRSEVERIQTSTRENTDEVKNISQVIASVKDQVVLLSEAIEEHGVLSGKITHDIQDMSANMSAISEQIHSNSLLVDDMGNIINNARQITDQVMALGIKSNGKADTLLSMASSLNMLTHTVGNE